MPKTFAQINSETRPATIVRRIWRDYLSQEKPVLGTAILGAVGVATTTGVLGVWLAPAVKLLFDQHDPGDKILNTLPQTVSDHPILWVTSVIIGLGILRFAFQRGLTLSLNKLGNELVGRIQQQLYSRLVRSDLAHLKTSHSGEYLSSVLYDADLVRDAASTGIVQYLQAILTVVSGIGTMLYYDWLMTILVILAGPLIAMSMSRYLKATNTAAQGAMTETSSLSTAVMESLDGIKVIKVANQESAEEDRIGEVITRRQTHLIKGANARSMAAPVTEMLTAFLLAALLGFAGWRAKSGGLNSADLLSFLIGLGTAGQALRQLAGLQGTFSLGMTAARRLFNALDVIPKIVDRPQAKDLGRDISSITFENVSFCYGAKPVLNQVSFSVSAGDSVALVGPSGSGKSTLLSLLPRFYDLNDGAIRIDGTDYRDFGLASLRSRIALVTQEPFLFDDTIRANIAYGNGPVSTTDIEQAAKDAAAHGFIIGLPHGYNTRVGEGGSQLSGGQKQRIAIARAFLKNAPIVLLDEATSALDTESEQKVQSALERLMKGRTTFMIAHRLSTIREAKQILVMNDGKIVEQGTHESLIAANGLYSRLAKTQFGDRVGTNIVSLK